MKKRDIIYSTGRMGIGEVHISTDLHIHGNIIIPLIHTGVFVHPHGIHCACPLSDVPAVGLGCPNPSREIILKNENK